MLSAFANSFRIPQVRQRILFTLSLIFIARVGAHIPLPGVDARPLQDFFAAQGSAGAGALHGLYNMFTGGALVKGAVFALGIMPYISASIILQLLTAIVPSLTRLQQEGDVGRQKLTQFTRWLTVGICLVQGALLIYNLQNPTTLFPGYDIAVYGEIVVVDHLMFLLTSVTMLTAGTLILMWLGEQITQRGLGNGISLIITIGILADIPGAASALWRLLDAPVGTQSLSAAALLGMILLFVIVTTGIVLMVQGQRKIPVQYAKRVVGNKVMGGQSSFLPLKVNYSGVMPVIFASAVLLFPQQIIGQVGAALNLKFLIELSNHLVRGDWFYYSAMTVLILFFSYFWVSVMFKPLQIADDLKKYGGYIPGVRPGEPTASFLDFVMTRLTLAGALALTVIAVMPDFLMARMHVPQRIAAFFGGTGMLITVGVILDTMRQTETFLLQRHYDGFLRRGRVKSRAGSGSGPGALTDAASSSAVRGLVVVTGAILAVGLISWMLRMFFASN